jgi:hypothetical protein
MPHKSTIRRKAYKKKWRKKHSSALKAYYKQYYRDNMPIAKFQARKRHLMRNFGMTLSQYDEKLEKQQGLCAICRRPPKKNLLHVDHDRKCCSGAKSCGKCIRDLLCPRCNVGLGMLETTGLATFQKYLEKHEPIKSHI